MTGTVTAPAITVGGTTYSNVTDAVQAAGAGFNLTTGKAGTGVANGTTVEGIAAGETVTVVAGNNLISTQTGNSIEVALNPALTGLTSIGVTGGATIDGTGIAMGGDKITGLAAGSTTAGSTEAVNGGQLNTGLASVAANLGGTSTYDPVTGTVTAPSYTIGATTFNDVGSALGAVDTAVTSLTNGTLGLVQQVGGAPSSGQIVVGSTTGGTSVSFTGTAGDRTLTGVAIGAISAASSDAVNGSQIFANQTSVATVLGGGSVVNPDGTISTPTFNVDGTPYNNVGAALAALDKAGSAAIDTNNTSALANPMATGTDATAISPGAVASGADSLAAGKNALASGDQAVAMGPNATADGTGATALGNGATAKGDSTTALGDNAQATAADATALGQNTVASGSMSTATGFGSTAVGAGSLASGNGATATGDQSTALGDGATATNTGDVALGAGSVTGTPSTGPYSLNGGTPAATAVASVVSVGAVGSERQITNVGAGTVTATSTDAVNGSQLFTVATAVNNLGAGTVAALGGGAKVAADGTVTAPSYTIGATTYNDVGSALTAMQTGAPVQYSTSGAPTTANGLVPSQNDDSRWCRRWASHTRQRCAGNHCDRLDAGGQRRTDLRQPDVDCQQSRWRCRGQQRRNAVGSELHHRRDGLQQCRRCAG